MKSLSSRLMDTRLLGAPWRELSIVSAISDISHPYLIDPQGKIRFHTIVTKWTAYKDARCWARRLSTVCWHAPPFAAPMPDRAAAGDYARERWAFRPSHLWKRGDALSEGVNAQYRSLG